MNAPKLIPTTDLIPGDSPRRRGVDLEHVNALAATDARLPPILVHHPSMRIIDGMHRLLAARLKNQETIEAQFFSGHPDQAFVLAVETNIAHGLPLSRADREAAAARILAAFPERSDRAIARSTGLSATKVGDLRRRTAAGAHLRARLGRDGRSRPVDPVAGRRRACDVIANHPEATLREIAEAAGISPGTAHDVRKRLRRGEDPIPARHRTDDRRPKASPAWDPSVVVRMLRDDPSLRFTESGRRLLRWLDATMLDPKRRDRLVDSMPPHCVDVLAELALGLAANWQELAARLGERGPVSMPSRRIS